MNSIIIVLAVAVLSVAVLGITGPHMVFAKKPADPDCFGESASDLAQSDPGMGEHSKAGSVAGEPPFDGPNDDEKKGRDGIGNVGGEGSETHPSEIPGILGVPCDGE